MVAACERSLRRLGSTTSTSTCCTGAASVPLRDTVAGFEALQQRGLIRHWGVSNFDLDDMQELFAVPGGERLRRQPGLVLARRAWRRVRPAAVAAAARAMPLMAYSPIDQGALARHAGLAALAARRGATPAQVALAWVLRAPGVIAIPKAVERASPARQLAGRRAVADPTTIARRSTRMFPPPRRNQALATGDHRSPNRGARNEACIAASLLSAAGSRCAGPCPR